MATPRASSETGFLLPLSQTLAAELREAVGEDFRIVRKWWGATAICYQLETEAGHALVFKHPYRDGHIEGEVRALRAAESVGLVERKIVPRLVAELDSGAAYLAEFVAGESIREALRRPFRRTLPAEIAAALAEYTGATGRAFGDFHPPNIIVRTDGITLIDPGHHGSDSSSMGTPLVADLGHWCSAAARTVTTHQWRSPRPAWRLLSLTAKLVAAGLDEGTGGAAQAEAIHAAAVAGLEPMRRDRWRRTRLAYFPALGIAYLIRWRVKRELQRLVRARLSPTTSMLPRTRD